MLADLAIALLGAVLAYIGGMALARIITAHARRQSLNITQRWSKDDLESAAKIARRRLTATREPIA